MRLTEAHRRMYRNGLLGLLAVVLLSTIASPASSASPPEPGSAGTDISLPDTDSAVTVTGRGAFSDLEIRVNQTRNLVNQAVSLQWSGAEPTVSNNVRFAEDYLQIMQCWGEDDGSIPANPGPPPEQCVQGAADGVPDGVNSGLFPPAGQTLTRIISRSSWENFDATVGPLDARSGLAWRSFRSVDGVTIDFQTNSSYNPFVEGSAFWLNPYFNIITTNEVSGAKTAPDGTGSSQFRIDTGVESSGLGCGQRLVPAGGGAPFTPKCWLVVVPRGDSETENTGTPLGADAGVYTSPLAPEAWANRISVPLEFNPVDSACSINDDDRRIVGSELLVPAVSNWQPALCATPGLPPYTFGTVSDATARAQVLTPSPGSAGMAVTQRPLNGPSDPQNPTVYAPITVSAAVIGFNIERNPLPTAEQAAQDLAGVSVAELNLTPRLVAKLLTQSYTSQVDIRGEPSGYEWRLGNPDVIGLDPDFLQFNPEFSLLQMSGGRNFGGLVLPVRNSDLTVEVWQWILADPEARAWLDGAVDPWGMRVNPVYATQASANVNGAAFGDPVPDTFPKADPYCYVSPPRGANNSIQPPPICSTDWMPYVQGLREASGATRSATDAARVSENPFALTADQVWRRVAPQTLGRRQFLSLTDSASAAQFGIQTARLSRAGDNGTDRTFIAADSGGLTAGLEGFAPSSEPRVLEPVPTAEAPSGYPLTAITYAAVKPLALDAAARAEYAAFVDFAAGPGQVSGLRAGELVPGYVPMSQELRGQAAAAADEIRELHPPPPAPAPAPPPASAASTSSGGSSSSSPPPASPSSSAGGRSTASVATPTAAPPVAAAAVVAEEETESSGLLTPILSLARNRFVLPALAVIAILAGLGALEINKRPRRGVPVPKAGS